MTGLTIFIDWRNVLVMHACTSIMAAGILAMENMAEWCASSGLSEWCASSGLIPSIKNIFSEQSAKADNITLIVNIIVLAQMVHPT